MKKIKTFIVSLKRRMDRREELIQKIPDNLDFSFTCDLGFDFDGKSMNDKDIKSYGLFEWKMQSSNFWWSRELKKGEIGCALAHFNIWKIAYNLKYSEILVLEDDVLFDVDFENKLDFYLKTLGLIPWDIFYLGRFRISHDLSTEYDGIVTPGYSHCTYAYMLSLHGIASIMKQNYDTDIIPVDEFLPALYVQHPRYDVACRYPKCLQAYALSDDIVFQVDKNIAGSDTEDTEFIVSDI